MFSFFLILYSSGIEISSGYIKLYLLKNLPAENLFLLLGILRNHEYSCVTHSFIVNRYCSELKKTTYPFVYNGRLAFVVTILFCIFLRDSLINEFLFVLLIPICLFSFRKFYILPHL